MRNALDDLTRPAPPVGLSATVDGSNLTVTVAPSADPRVNGFVAAVRVPPGRWRLLCRGTLSCTGKAPQGVKGFIVAAGLLDPWHRHSAPARIVVGTQR